MPDINPLSLAKSAMACVGPESGSPAFTPRAVSTRVGLPVSAFTVLPTPVTKPKPGTARPASVPATPTARDMPGFCVWNPRSVKAFKSSCDIVGF